jgi:hypothetical protein
MQLMLTVQKLHQKSKKSMLVTFSIPNGACKHFVCDNSTPDKKLKSSALNYGKCNKWTQPSEQTIPIPKLEFQQTVLHTFNHSVTKYAS